MIGIYSITNNINGKMYIGQSIHILSRWKQHIYIALNNLEEKTKLYNAIRKYGINNFTFTIIKECLIKQLDELEKYYISYYNTYENGYNMTCGGQGEDRWMFNPQLIQKLWDEGLSIAEIKEIIGCCNDTIRKNLEGYSNYTATESHSRGMKNHIKKYELNNGIPYTATQIWKIYFDKSIPVYQYALTGEYITSYTSAAEAGRALGYQSGGANILKCLNSKSNNTAYGFQWTREYIDKMPISTCHGSKLIQCIETGIIYPSAIIAAKENNIKNANHISDCCQGKQKTCGKLHWQYAD